MVTRHTRFLLWSWHRRQFYKYYESF